MNILYRSSKSLLALAILLWGNPSYATVYNMVPDGIVYNSATRLVGTIETDQIGTFSLYSAPNIFNKSKYSFSIYDGQNLLAHLDNTNSVWSLLYGGEGTITLTPSKMTFQFATPMEYTAEYLFVRSVQPDGRWFSAAFAQNNNVGDSEAMFSDFDAMYMARRTYQYNTPMIFDAVTRVPEPATRPMLLAGLMALAGVRAMTRKRH